MLSLETTNKEQTANDVKEGMRNLRSNGIFTIEGPIGRKTFKLSTVRNEKSGLHGKRILAYLSGPENSSDYTGFAFVESGDRKQPIRVWSKFKFGEMPDWANILLELVNGAEIPAWIIQAATTCVMCNRLLTTPESIRNGIGPICGGI